MDRTQAIAFMDQWWPATRGAIVTAEQARKMLLEAHPADQFLQYDVARQDAMLTNLIGGGLLEFGPTTEDRQLTYKRPLSDELPAPKPQVEPTFHPSDGSAPMPYSEYLRRQAEKAAAPKPEPTVGPLPPWASIVGDELRLDLNLLCTEVATVSVIPQTRKPFSID